jgi:S1-C subfamily serine protease
MRLIQLGFALLFVVMGLGALAGRTATSEAVDTITPMAEAAPVTTMADVARPDAALAGDAVVANAARSVVKVSSFAYSCQKVMAGSGFVIAPGRVMTNAHVVAGGDIVTVWVDGREHAATVVLFNTSDDISILDVADLQAPPLAFADGTALTGTDAVVLGYPGGGPFVAYPARVREVIDFKGPDLYHALMIRREVYTIRGMVRSGDSGGPLIDRTGRVLGMNFAAAAHDPEVGFVLTSKQILPHTAQSGTAQPVTTGPCIS